MGATNDRAYVARVANSVEPDRQRAGRLAPALLVDRESTSSRAERRHLRQSLFADLGAAKPAALSDERVDWLPAVGCCCCDQVLALSNEAAAAVAAASEARSIAIDGDSLNAAMAATIALYSCTRKV